MQNLAEVKTAEADTSSGGNANRPKPRRGWRGWLLLLGLMAFIVPVLVSAADYWWYPGASHWSQAARHSSGQAPDPAITPEAVVQVYAARAFSWRGILGVHSWIAYKPENADRYTRLEVIGWGVNRGYPAVRRRHRDPDALWFGSRPTVLAELRGPAAARAIPAIEQAAADYPHNDQYRVWPGPNSNTFTAHIGRAVPALCLDLPATAIGKDYIAGHGLLARSPSGTGVQVSLFGVLGLMVGLEEGLELNVLGLSAGVDLNRPALRLPGVGRLGFAE